MTSEIPFHDIDNNELFDFLNRDCCTSTSIVYTNENPLNENFIYVEDDDDIFEEQINIDPDMNLRVCTDNQCSYIQHEALLNVLQNNSNKDLSLIELNIRSLPKNVASLELLIDQFRDRLHFILLVETWLTSASTDHYGLDGFRFESNYRKKKKGGGTAIYIQDSVMYTSLPKVGRVTDDTETTFIKIDKHNHLLDKDLVLGVCYRPPNGDIDTFLLQITDIFHMLKVHDCYLYIAGDFNLNLLEKSKKHKIDCYFNTLLSYGLLPLISKPTRCVNESFTLIDNIFMNNLKFPHQSNILLDDISDHFPIFTTIKNVKHTTTRQYHPIRNISKKNLERFYSACFQEN